MLFETARVNLGVSSEILNSVKVNLFHPQPVVRVGLAKWLEQVGVCHFSVKSSATELLDSSEDEILLLGIESIQGLDGDAFRRLERCFAQKTVVLATRGQLDRFGWRLPKNIGSLISPCSALGEFVHAIRSVTNRNAYMDPSLSATWSRVATEAGFELTNRQLQVLRLVANGKTSVQIAALLGLRKKTIENHSAAIKERMCVASAAEMVNKAHLRGIC